MATFCQAILEHFCSQLQSCTHITWNPGTGGNHQALLAAEDPQAVYFNCQNMTDQGLPDYSNACALKENNLPNSQTAYQANKSLFAANTVSVDENLHL